MMPCFHFDNILWLKRKLSTFKFSVAKVSVKFQSDRTILNKNIVALRLREILQWDIISDNETGPRQTQLRMFAFISNGNVKKSTLHQIRDHGSAINNVIMMRRIFHSKMVSISDSLMHCNAEMCNLSLLIGNDMWNNYHFATDILE